ncbi:uncharacterized protein LOC113279339 [Papaver somniferum]|uniref:uncharacterized protein LOC113279339 n=1 Tax=Papaver somniferum TaxID=3469 RepID=UPI000E702CCF|nr:uncharacterized protein LOC113279339 [Papaver somniferum]
MVNKLDTKRRGGKFGLKIDITQAYDSLSWNFPFQVMSKFGFTDKGIYWLQILLKSARIFVLVNGGPEGYFQVERGLSQGGVKSFHVWNCVKMMHEILVGWKVYRWPKRILKECQRIIKNFLWTDDPSQRKQVTLKWKPLSEGGLGIRRLEVINKSLLMKLFWKIQNGTEEWDKFFQAKFQNKKGDGLLITRNHPYGKE